jgi:hypothetical protein
MYYHGYTHAIRFDRWDFIDVSPYESAMERVFGPHRYDRSRGDWYSSFGTKNSSTGYKPYYIYVRSEEMITMTLLAV